MRLWHLERTDEVDYDEWSEAIVVAPDEDAARGTHPNGERTWPRDRNMWGMWQEPYLLRCTRLGTADDPTPRVVCAVFLYG